MRVLHASGDVRLLSITGAPILNEHGRVIAAIGIGRDVTQARADAFRLTESERKLRLLVQSVTETVFTLDTSLRFTALYSGRSSDALLHAPNVIGKTSAEVLRPLLGDAFARSLERALGGERVD